MKNKLLSALSLAMILAMLVTSIGFAAELVTAEVTGTTNEVTIVQGGGSVSSTIQLSATGAISGLILSANASTAKVDTVYTLTGGVLSSATSSSAMKFYSSGLGCSGANCDVTWDSYPSPYSVIASFSANATTPVGDYIVTLQDSSAGTTDTADITNPSVSGGKLGDTTPTTITVHVISGTPVKTTPTITWANPTDIVYGTALSGTQLNAAASVPGSFVYAPAAGEVLSAGSHTLHVDFTPTDTTNYNNASKDVTINVLKADAGCNISGYSGIYDGNAHGASGSCTGVGTLNLGDSFTDVPGGTAHWTFTGSSNYNDAAGNAAITIGQASSITTVTVSNAIYDGNAHGGSASVTGAGLNQSLTVSYAGRNGTVYPSSTTAPTSAGDYTASASFGGDTNHTGSSDSKDFSIGQATSSVAVDCTVGAPFTYNGSAQTPCTAKASGVGMSDVDVTSSLVYHNNTNAGPATVDASWAGDDNHTGNTGSGGFSIGQATSSVAVDCTVGAPFTYNGSAQTPCTAKASGVGMSDVDVTSSLVYHNNTNAGPATVDASWAGDDNHTGNTGSGGFSIGQATSSVAVDCTVGAPFTYNGSAQTPCTAKASGVGMSDVDVTSSLVYHNNTNAGPATVDANWAGDANHTGNTGSGGFSIGQATSSVAVDCTVGAPFTYNGSAQTPCTAKASGVGMSDVDVTSSLVYHNNTNAGPATVDASWAGDDNHTGNTGSGGFSIGQATSSVAVDCTVGAPFTYNGSAQTPCTAKASGVGMSDVDVTSSLVYHNNTNAGPATVDANWAGDANHTGNTGSGGFTIGKADATCLISGYTGVYDGASHGATGSCSGIGGENAGTLILGATFTNVPGGTAHWVFTGNGNYKDQSGNVAITINPWTFGGFYQPVDMGNILNTVKNGSTVPLKFEIFSGSTKLTDTINVKSISAVQYTCTAGVPEDAIETVVSTTGGSALRYDTTAGQFIFNWKTPSGSSVVGKCYRVTMESLDGSKLIAFFKLK